MGPEKTTAVRPARCRASWLGAILTLALPWALQAQGEAPAAPPAAPPAALAPASESPAGYVVRPARLETPPVIDGRLDDPVWQTAARIGDFHQLEPKEGEPATEPTEVYLGFDKDSLYIGVRCHDSEPGKIVSTTLTRDSDMTYDDTIQVQFDTYRDGRSAYLFLTNPDGVQVDALVRNEGEQVSLDWDAVWDVQSTRDDGGWSTEIEIPWRSLRFPEKPEQEWGFIIERQVARKQERTFWKAPTKSWYARWKLSEAGTIVGLEGARPGNRFHFSPYLIGGAEKPPDGSTDSVGRIGGDLKINLTSDLVADVTVKTDFSEIESDQQEVNLSRNPLFFPEKRGFFLEGASNFYAGQRPDPEHLSEYILFFSRRVGLSDDGRATIPILGGVKLTGHAGKYSLGGLAVRTEETRKDDGYGGLIVAPQTDYSVARVKRDLGNTSTIGLIGLSKDTADGYHNRTFGADWDIAFNKLLRTGGYFAKSSTPGVEGDDHAGSTNLYWDSKHWRLHTEYIDVGENFNNEMGFMGRTDIRSVRTDYFWILWPESGPFKLIWLTYDYEYIETRSTGRLQTRNSHIQWNSYFKDSSGFAYKYFVLTEVLTRPFEIQKGIFIQPGTYDFGYHFFGFQTDYTKPLGAAGRVAWGDYYDGHFIQTFYYAAYRPVPGLIVAGTYQHTHINLTAGRFDSDIALTEVVYAFNNRLAARAWYQWTKDANERTKVDVSWELKNGTKLFLVYQDIRSYLDFFNPRQPLFGTPGRSLTFKTVLAL